MTINSSAKSEMKAFSADCQPLALRLRQELERRQEKNSRYSLRAYSRDLKIDFSLLSRLMNGKIPFTKKILQQVGEALPLHAEELDFYQRILDQRRQAKKRLAMGEIDPLLLLPPARTMTLEFESGDIKINIAVLEKFLNQAFAEKEDNANLCKLHISLFF